jgi:hypothetical protein
MKIKIIFIVFLCLLQYRLLPFSPADTSVTIPEFRNIQWGTSQENVRKQESAYYLQTFMGFGLVTLSFRDKLAGLETRVDYTFKNGNFTEGAYIIKSGDSFKNDFIKLLDYLTDQYGRPEYRSGPQFTSDSIWVKKDNNRSLSGPAFYWNYKNGFIGMISSKFEEDITITILYAYGTSIENYVENNGVELNKFNFKVIDK